MSKRQVPRHVRDTSIGELLFRIFHFVAKPDGLYDVRAVKEVPAASEDGEYVSSRLSEVEALMQLDHPNVVKLYEYFGGEAGNDTLLLVEEFLTGGTLERRVQKAGGQLDADESAVVLRQILRGVLC